MKKILLALSFVFGVAAASAQEMEKDLRSNIVKLNVTSLAFKTISVQYERIIKKSFSAAISFRTMPNTELPFKNKFADIVGDGDPYIEEGIKTMKLSSFAITPEVRWYVGKKGYGRGFYIAPFYRYTTNKISDIRVSYDDALSAKSTINLSGNLNSNTAGVLFGAQWMLSKNIALDWWILGPHYGSGKGDFVGVSSRPLNAIEQNNLRQELEDYDIPLTKKTVNVNSTGATVNLDGPWGGVRAGISIGIAF
ncbi:MAG: hypothetical protein JWQ27_1467 [Ferruginibacter sp.]|nr:hypothetical protein [Ferruginibacter sp.]